MRRTVTGPVETLTHPKARGPSGRHDRRIARYLLVGTASFFLDAGCIWLTYRKFHLQLAAATTLGFVAGLAFNFTASKLFTFEVRSDGKGQVVRYAVLLGVNYLLTLIIVSSSEAWGPGYLAGKLCSVGLITCSNYLVLHHWVFVTPSPRSSDLTAGLAKDNMQNIGEGRDIEHRNEQRDR